MAVVDEVVVMGGDAGGGEDAGMRMFGCHSSVLTSPNMLCSRSLYPYIRLSVPLCSQSLGLEWMIGGGWTESRMGRGEWVEYVSTYI